MEIIIRDSTKKMGRTRSQQEEQLRKEWGPTLTDAQLDKLKHIERKVEETTGSKDNYINAGLIDKVK